MPKFRDLGINAIPMNMRPLEMGGTSCANNGDPTCGPCDRTTDDRGTTATCREQATCDGRRDDKKKHTAGFAPEATLRLRQQLESQLGA